MSVSEVRAALLTREYPPDVYGGAGVHVEYLARELAKLVEVTVHCWGEPRPADWRPPVVAHQPWDELVGSAPPLAALRAVSIDLAMSAAAEGATIVHSHTWYANLGGHLTKLIHAIPHVATVHSLEPLRPWKEEQLGGGYRSRASASAPGSRTPTRSSPSRARCGTTSSRTTRRSSRDE